MILERRQAHQLKLKANLWEFVLHVKHGACRQTQHYAWACSFWWTSVLLSTVQCEVLSAEHFCLCILQTAVCWPHLSDMYSCFMWLHARWISSHFLPLHLRNLFCVTYLFCGTTDNLRLLVISNMSNFVILTFLRQISTFCDWLSCGLCSLAKVLKIDGFLFIISAFAISIWNRSYEMQLYIVC